MNPDPWGLFQHYRPGLCKNVMLATGPSDPDFPVFTRSGPTVAFTEKEKAAGRPPVFLNH
jgi:hypothetical protein